jgi:Inner membrane component of T3SS, cytoplasmic domain
MDSFLQACGSGGPLHLNLDWPGGAGGECISFDTPFVVVGSDPGSDLVLEHGLVSARHAYLQLIDGHLLGIDLDSHAGTELGEAIGVGPYQIRLIAVAGERDGRAIGPADEADPTRRTLRLCHRGFKTSECRIDGGLTLVGRAANCQVRLLDEDVSDFHCSLVSTASGVWVVDLLGKEGIRVNGMPVRHALLSEGDLVQVGQSTIQLRQAIDDDTPARPAAEAGFRDVATPPALFGDRVPSGADEESETFSFRGLSHLSSFRETSGRPGKSARPIEAEDEALATPSEKDRRGSCRYTVAEVGVILSWYEPVISPAVVAAGPKLTPDEENIYSKVMARWPGNHNGTPSSRAGVATARNPLPSVETSRKSCVANARVLDISHTGLLVLCEIVPLVGQRAWVRLASPQATDWIEVVQRGSTPAGQGRHRIRLAFLESCPYEFFKLVVYSKPGS